MIRIKRAYEPFASADGKRFLVERLWPRGIRGASPKAASWLDLAIKPVSGRRLPDLAESDERQRSAPRLG